MEAWQRSLDNYLTSEPSWMSEPIHFTVEDNGEGGTQCTRTDFVDEGMCSGCEDPVGRVQTAEKETSGADAYDFITYWQIDEDGEHLLCETCYENEPLELDECVKCEQGAWLNIKGLCSECREENK
jgi:hypothetical protein